MPTVTLMQGQPPPIELPRMPEPLILIPYTAGKLHDETVDAVRAAGYPYTLWPIDAQDVYAYGALFADFWAKPGDLVIIEQDIVPPAGSITKLIECTYPWCSHYYYCNNPVPAYGLGMCRFTDTIKRRLPSLGEQAARDYRGHARRMHYLNLNERIISLMHHWGVTAHMHDPIAAHLHDYGTGDGAA